MRHETSMRADRLQRVLNALRIAGPRGMTSREIIMCCDVNSARDAVFDLRSNGMRVASRRENNGRTQFNRYWLTPFQPADAEVRP